MSGWEWIFKAEDVYKMNSKIRVLLCGAVFGQIYLRGVLKSDDYELRGILSKGSALSRSVASKYGLKLHTDIDEVDSRDYDLALVVVRSAIVGGAGSDIAEELLEKGISVIEEQPVHMEEALKCFKTARQKGVMFDVNTFYPYLPASVAFHGEVKRIKETGNISMIEGGCSMPVLLPFLDQICRIAGGVNPYAVDGEHAFKRGIRSFIPVKINNCECLLKISGSLNREDINNNAFILNELAVSSACENLVMTEVNGQVVRIAKPYVVEEYLREEVHTKEAKEAGTTVIYDTSGKTFAQLYEDVWPLAVKTYLAEHAEYIRNGECNIAQMQYYTALCGLWKEISDLMSVL